MKARFTEPIIEAIDLTPEGDIMDAPVLISNEPGTESKFIMDKIRSSYTAWKGKQY